MMRWAQTLVGRMLMLQLASALLLALLFFVFATSLQSVDAVQGSETPAALALAAAVTSPTTAMPAGLLSGPPPSDAHSLAPSPHHRVLARELQHQGVQLKRIMASGFSADAVVWMELQRDQTPPQWVGFRGGFERADFRQRRVGPLLVALLTLLAGAWWLSRRVTRPLVDLGHALERYRTDGELPAAPDPSAPLEVRELAEQFAAWAQQRRLQEETRDVMLAGISHDLRTPLGRIRLAAELLPDTAENQVRRDAIVRNVQLADRLLGSFIDLARAADEQLLEQVDLYALVTTASNNGDLDDVELDLSDHGRMPIQPANALGLERLLANLVNNARVHGRPPIHLSLIRDANHAVLVVRDHGEGVPEPLREALLQPFHRAEQSRHTSGAGLGLAIVQRTAQRHGGTAVLINAMPGLRVEVRLPLRLSDDQSYSVQRPSLT